MAGRKKAGGGSNLTISFKDAAERVLKKARRPLHYKQIVANVIRDRLIPLEGKTPEATMLARLGSDISSLKERSRFVKLGSGVYGLTVWGTKPALAGGKPAPERKVETNPVPPPPPVVPKAMPAKAAPPHPLSLDFSFESVKDLKEVTEALALVGAIYPDFDSIESQLVLVCTHFLSNHPTDDSDPKPIKRLLRAWEQAHPAQFIMLWEDKLEFGEELFNDIRKP